MARAAIETSIRQALVFDEEEGFPWQHYLLLFQSTARARLLGEGFGARDPLRVHGCVQRHAVLLADELTRVHLFHADV